jgi:hypothetical protein
MPHSLVEPAMPHVVVVLVAYRPAHISRWHLEDCKESALEIFTTETAPGGLDPIGYVAVHWAKFEDAEDEVPWDCRILVDGRPVDTDRMDWISRGDYGQFSPEQRVVVGRLLDAYNQCFVALKNTRTARRLTASRARDEVAVEAEKDMLRQLAGEVP